MIDFWTNEVSVTNDILSRLQSLVGAPGYDQSKVRTLITLIAEQSEIATRIYNKIKVQEWLTEKDNQDIERYSQLVEETERMLETFLKRSI